MLARLRNSRAKDSGFTLTELLIVIVILGVLAGIVVFAVGAFTNNGTSAACKADKKAVEVAVEAYRAQKGTYPTDDPTGTPTPQTAMQKLLDPDDSATTPDGYLRQAPSNAGYTITLVSGNGQVNSVGC